MSSELKQLKTELEPQKTQVSLPHQLRGAQLLGIFNSLRVVLLIMYESALSVAVSEQTCLFNSFLVYAVFGSSLFAALITGCQCATTAHTYVYHSYYIHL